MITLQARTPCGNAATSVDQVVFPYIEFAATPVSCPGASDGTLAATVPNAGNLSYLWNVPPPNTSASISGLPGGSYSVTVTAPNTCPATANYVLQEPLPLQANMTLLAAGCGTSSGSARVDISGGTAPYSFAWTPGGDTTAVAGGLNPGPYAVAVTDAGGCTTAGAIDIPEDCVNDVLFPSAFTPNGDGRNDVFYASFVRIVTYEIRIFDRWGQLVFKSDDIYQPWDGTRDGDLVRTGVYSYFASYSIDGIDYKEKKGRVTLYY